MVQNVGGKILIVDDERDNFDVLEILLFKENYQLSYVQSGSETFQFLEQNEPDVILLDVMMPELDGIEVCRQIKTNPKWQHIPIIMITALNSKQDLANSLETGADDFISKPVNGVELRARVRSMLRIKRQYDSLQAALKLREDMSYMIIHDLRNPLTSIALSCSLLGLTQLEDRQKEKVSQIQLASQRLQSLVDSLLIMAKIEAGKIVLNYTEVDFADLGRKSIEDIQAFAIDREIKLVSQLPPQGKTLNVDVDLFRRILDNLLCNAVKFSPSGTQVTLKIDYPEDVSLRIQVSDEGNGVTSALQQSLFKKYEIGKPMQGVTQTGLGLAFCKMAVEAHQGRIYVENRQPKGAIFTVEI